MTLQKQWVRLKGSEFLRSVSVLVSGTILSQAAAALALPILTRLYSPNDFSALAVFTGLLSIVSVAACLRFDVAIPIPEHDSDAAGVFCLAILCLAAISTLTGILVLGFPSWIAAQLKQPSLEPYLFLLPLAVIFSGTFSACQYWFVRKKDFGSIAKTRVIQTCAGTGAQVGAGWGGWLTLGLLLGPTLGAGIGCLGLINRLVRTDKLLLQAVNLSLMRSLLFTYKYFPKYSALEAMSNNAGIHLPIIVIASLASGPEAGFVLLAMYAMQAPMALVGGAIAQVYLSRAPDHFRAGQLRPFTAGVFGGLVKAGIGPLVFAALIAPSVFPLIFGNEWARAGVLMVWMTPWFVMQFLASPVSMALFVTNQHKTALILQVFGLLLRIGAVYGVSIFWLNRISEAYALSGFVFYFVYLVVVFRAADVRIADIALEIHRGIPFVLIWIVAGCGVALAVSVL